MRQLNVGRRLGAVVAVAGAAAALSVPAVAAKKPAKVPGNAKKGKVVFVTNCGACHRMKAAKTVGSVGPNLDKVKLKYAKIVTMVTKGKGTMPAFKGVLKPAQIKDVAAFVYAKK